MTRQIQIRRGTATENDAFTGAVGEVTMDTTNNTLRVHDGTTPGGTVLAKKSEIPSQQTLPDNYDFVIESQLPTAENNYTWYRKYKSGWVEQGGYASMTDAVLTISFPITMSNTNYTLLVFQEKNADGQNVPGITAKTTSSFSINPSGFANGSWQVSGFSA